MATMVRPRRVTPPDPDQDIYTADKGPPPQDIDQKSAPRPPRRTAPRSPQKPAAVKEAPKPRPGLKSGGMVRGCGAAKKGGGKGTVY
jgi:hypothetical protein